MDILELNNTEINKTKINKEDNVSLFNLNKELNTIINKINNIELINELLIEEISVKLKLYCKNHNNNINNWFDEQYKEDLNIIKNNNKQYNNLSDIYHSKSFILINF
jgi:hypothetical protein